MYRRHLPPFPDLRSFIKHLSDEGDVATIDAPVDMALEATEIHRRVIAEGGPVLRFAKPLVSGQISNVPAIANLFGTRARVAARNGNGRGGIDRARRDDGVDAFAPSRPPRWPRRASSFRPPGRG